MADSQSPSIPALGTVEHVEGRAPPVAPQKYVERSRAAVGGPRGYETQHVTREHSMRQPLDGGVFEHRPPARGTQAATRDDQHGAMAFAYRRLDELLERLL